MSQPSGDYKGIFKSTFLFSFVQIVNIVTKVTVNKVVAILLGAEGLGMISLYNSAISMLRSGCGLGIKQSAVRDVAEANEEGNTDRISTIISVTNRVVLFTALFGFIVTLIASPLLSKYSFGSYVYIIPFMILSAAVALNIYAEGQMAIITGMRRLRDLAIVNIVGSVVGMISSIPLYYFFGKDGIVPSLVLAALCMFIVTKVYVNKIPFERIKLTVADTFRQAKPMVQMGSVLMLASFAALVVELLVSSFVRHEGGFATVGFYQAGSTIIHGYFGVVLTAMTTDYYPRICGVNKDNSALKIELNKQVASGIILVFPLAVCFVFLAPLFISFLYSGDFVVTTQYTDIAVLGTILVVAATCMGMVFMAKMASKLYLKLVLSALLCQVCLVVPLYNMWGLYGLGITYVMNGVICLVLYGILLRKKYGISLSKGNWLLIVCVLITIAITVLTRSLPNRLLSYVLGSAILIGSTVFSLLYLDKKMGINILEVVKHLLHK